MRQRTFRGGKKGRVRARARGPKLPRDHFSATCLTRTNLVPRNFLKWCRGTELNCRHQPFQGCALPTELPRHGSRQEEGGTDTGSSEKNQAAWSVWFIWFLWFIWFISFNQTHETDRIDQMNKIGCGGEGGSKPCLTDALRFELRGVALVALPQLFFSRSA